MDERLRRISDKSKLAKLQVCVCVHCVSICISEGKCSWMRDCQGSQTSLSEQNCRFVCVCVCVCIAYVYVYVYMQVSVHG
jgi:hypothetical protein